MNQPEEELKELHEDRFEQDLMRALRRVDAPKRFADRVMVVSATAVPSVEVFTARWTIRTWLSGAVAAGLVAGAFLLEQQHLRRGQEERVQRQFEVAMRVTDRALEHTREQLVRTAPVLGD